MANFKIRKSGNDLKDLKVYNNGDWNASKNDYINNAFFPEYAPKSVGGSMSGVSHPNAKGNCTWYAFGRYLEVFGVRPDKPQMRPDAKYWGTKGEKLSPTPQIGGIVVFGDNSYGHVAFIEDIVGNDVILSESSYSTRGNDFLFKYGRTVEQVKKEWNMTVLRYIAPHEVSTSYHDTQAPLIEELGTFTATKVNGSNVRKEPNLDASSRVRGIPKGGKFDYTHYLDVGGIRWVTNGKEFVARRKLDNSEIYGDAAFRNVAPKPTPKPLSNVGKYANLGGDMWLFESARTDKTYHPKGMGYNQLQPVRNRSAKILADDNGRVKISVPSFRPNVVWVAKSQISITDKPKYSVN